jgi:hypothetical protein
MIVKCTPTQPNKEPCPMIKTCLARLTDRTITGCGVPLFHAGLIRKEEVMVEHTGRRTNDGRVLLERRG